MHTEMGPWMPPSVSSDVVICAGDIGVLNNLDTLEKYFDDVWKTTDNVIWILGNHEFYHGEYDECLRIAQDFAKARGIHLLDEAIGTENLEIDGVTFWGSTLWTDFNSNDWFAKNRVGRNLNDFHVVNKERFDGKFTNFNTEDALEINVRTREKINWDADVVITHHVPALIEHRRFPLDDITYGFCNTGLEEQIKASNIKFWVYGHNHDSMYIQDKERFGDTILLSNQQGYYNRWGTPGDYDYEDTGGFDPALTFEVKK